MRGRVVAAAVVAITLSGIAEYGSAQEQVERSATETAPVTASPSTTESQDTRPDAPVVGEVAVTPDEAAPPPDAAAPAPPAVAPPPPPPEPLKRPRFGAAVLQAVDKVTAETLRFEARVGEPVRYKGLVLTVRACEQTAADEEIGDSVANVDVRFQPTATPGRATIAPRPVFHGWMFASSAGLHPFEQPSYDVWLIACKAASGPAASA